MTTTNPTVIPEAPLPHEILSRLYSNMLKARLLAKHFRNAQRMSEAVLAATLENSQPADLFITAGDHPTLSVLTGTPIASLTAAKNGNAASSRVIVAGTDAAAGIASGLAMALNNSSSAAMVIAFLPSKITRGSSWEQATQFAAANRLPIVFVSDGTNSRSPRNHDGKALSHWPFPTIAVDGRDVIGVFRVTMEAISAARRGHGPTLVDCVDFVAPGKRGKDTRDALASFRGYLKRHHAWDDRTDQVLEKQLASEISGK
jgi:hypothetical protein